jgi:hypothetical protein
MGDPTIREPDQIHQDAACKLRAVKVSEHFPAIRECLLGEDGTTPRLHEMMISPDGHMLGRGEGQPGFSIFLSASEDVLRNIHGSSLNQTWRNSASRKSLEKL